VVTLLTRIATHPQPHLPDIMKFLALLAAASLAIAAPIEVVEDRGLATTTAASGQGWGGAGSSECFRSDHARQSSELIDSADGGWPFKRDEEERGLATTTAASGQGWGGAGSSECLFPPSSIAWADQVSRRWMAFQA
jgi:hypothetical protein